MLQTRPEIPRERKRVEAFSVIRIGRRILLYCEVEMSPVGRINRRQIVVLFQRFDRFERAVNPCLAEGVKQQDSARFDTRNGRDLISGPGRFGYHNPPGLRAISVAPPAHKTEGSTGRKGQKFAAGCVRKPLLGTPKEEAVLASALRPKKPKMGRNLRWIAGLRHAEGRSNLRAIPASDTQRPERMRVRA